MRRLRIAFLRIPQIILALALGAACTACMTGAQRDAQAIRANNHAVVSTRDACLRAVQASPEYVPLIRHFPPIGSQPALQQETDSAFATDEEIKALFAEHPEANACRQQEMNRLAEYVPTIVPIVASAYSRIEDDMIGLVQKKTSWGEYTREVKAISDETRTQLATEWQRIGARLEQSHEAELARRQAAAAAIAQFAQTQAAINAMNRPMVTTCNAYGNSATCVTH